MNQDKSFVFNRIELAVLILFFLIASATAFILGIRFGEQYYWAENKSPFIEGKIVQTNSGDDITLDSINRISSSSVKVENLEKKIITPGGEELQEIDVDDATFKKLQIELAKLERKKEDEASLKAISTEVNALKMNHSDHLEKELTKELDQASSMELLEEEEKSIDEQLEEAVAEAEAQIDRSVIDGIKDEIDQKIIRADDSLVGKFTIQLGSFQTYQEAKSFSENFVARNYRPIINQVDLGDRGTWFRVGLGIFDTEASARKYRNREASLFDGQDTYINIIE